MYRFRRDRGHPAREPLLAGDGNTTPPVVKPCWGAWPRGAAQADPDPQPEAALRSARQVFPTPPCLRVARSWALSCWVKIHLLTTVSSC